MKRVVTTTVLALGLLALQAHAQTYSRTDTIAYEDHLGKWVLGQPKSSTNVNTGLVEFRTDHDPVTALPLRTYAFGKLQQTMTYNADGTLATVSDGRDSAAFNTTVSFSQWKRGVPQRVTFPDGTYKAASVDDLGLIRSVDDEVGHRTCFDFDAMGRLSKITYPSDTVLRACDTSRWNTLDRSLSFVTTAEYGLPANHWREQVTTGNARKFTYYDALLRPVLTQTYDNANSGGTLSQVVTRYAPQGGVAFQSYPVNKGAALNVADAALPGTRTTYDALGRVTRVEQDSEHGPLVTTTAYLSGLQSRVTNPRGQATTTTYGAFDQPTTDWPMRIDHPEGAITQIARDTFGKPLWIARRNAANTVGLTRSYAYNAAQELCRTIEPETGTTLMGYDAAGNLAWSAAGLSVGSPPACDSTAQVVLDRRSTRTYDNRNRLTTLKFADGLGEQAWTYTPDGLPASAWHYNGAARAQGVYKAYTYNSRRLLTAETQHQPGWYTWTLGKGYDRNGFVASETYPDTSVFTYALDALGRTTAITSASGTYVSGASYHPNGALKQFTYGNGIVHTLAQNLRGLPDRSRDVFGSLVVLDDGYDYDFNGNVAAISDGRPNGDTSRTMTYDGLDRLASVQSPMFNGTIRYTYDVLDNLVTLSAPAQGITPARNLRYCYKAGTNRLEFLRTNVTDCTNGSATTSFEFDPQGNIKAKNQQGYFFTQGNRLRDVVGVESYRYDANGRRVLSWSPTLGNLHSAYSLDGRLLHQTDTRPGQGKSLAHVYLAGSLVATRETPMAGGAAVLKFQHTDALGSPVAVTTATRAVVERSKYEPYGKVIDRPLRDRPGYTGHAEDALTGLSYMQQRYYDPVTGRFSSVDPVTVNSRSGGNFNRYWYANNNPYRFTDPDGREAGGGYATGQYAIAQPTMTPEAAEFLVDVAVSAFTDFVLGGPSGEGVGIFAGIRAARVADKAVDATKGAANGTRAGKTFTRAGKAEVKADNAARNGGQTKCSGCGQATVPAQQSRSGVTPPKNEAHVDHVIPKSKGGNGSPDNGQVLCRECNLRKGDKL